MRFLVRRFLIVMMAACSSPCFAAGMDVMKDFQGIAYTEQGSAVGLPMGGIGAGCIEITSKGTLAEFAHLNNWTLRIPSIKGTGLTLTYRTGAKTRVFPLGEQKVKFEGNFPFAKLTFPNLPVKLTLWCWSPFILHNARHSAYPVAIFDAEVVNTSKTKAEVGLALSYGTDYGAWTRYLAPDTLKDVPTISMRSTPKLYSGKNVQGISFSTVAEQNPVANYIYPNANADITLSARTQANAKVFTYQVAKPDSIPDALTTGETTAEANPTTYAVEQRSGLAPGKSGMIGLVASWYAPSHFNYNGYRLGHKYEEWFKTSAAAAEEVARERESLLAKTKRDYDLIAKSTLPKWYREMVQSNFYLLPSTTWWTKDGISFTYESPNGCPLHGTM
ncbi:MAG: GH116 family glycosyl-hydrolase, partial [Armatimonadota bacterium]